MGEGVVAVPLFVSFFFGSLFGPALLTCTFKQPSLSPPVPYALEIESARDRKRGSERRGGRGLRGSGKERRVISFFAFNLPSTSLGFPSPPIYIQPPPPRRLVLISHPAGERPGTPFQENTIPFLSSLASASSSRLSFPSRVLSLSRVSFPSARR